MSHAPQKFIYQSMGTQWEISIWNGISKNAFTALSAEIEAASQKFVQDFSRFEKSSLIWKLSEQTGLVAVPKDLVSMLKIYKELYDVSYKKLNPLIGFTLSDLGYDDLYSLQKKDIVRSTPDFSKAVSIIDEQTIELHQKVLIDLGALGKGFFVDSIAALLKNKGINHFLVNASGDIYYDGPEPLTVALEDPANITQAVGIVKIPSGAVCASGINRRAWKTESQTENHIVDPESNSSVSEIIASWVWTKSASYADALATALLLAPPDTMQEALNFEYCLLNNKRKIKRSTGFTAELF